MANIKKTLLERIKEIKPRKIRDVFVDDELIEVMISYYHNEIQNPQLEKVLGWPGNSAKYKMTGILKKAIESGKVSLNPFIGGK